MVDKNGATDGNELLGDLLDGNCSTVSSFVA